MDETQKPNDDGMNPAAAPMGGEGSQEQTSSDTAPAETSAPAEETPQEGM